MKPRRESREITLGGLTIGGRAPVRVQSMTKTDTRDVAATVSQIGRLAEAGCEVVRVAVVDEEAARSLSLIKDKISLPLVADIHFDHRLGLKSLAAGADGLRVNPGNIGGRDKLLLIAEAAAECGACLRVGVNAGSLEKDILARFGRPTPETLALSAAESARVLEEAGFFNFKVSLKSSSVKDTVAACRAFAAASPAPLHLGVTEAGPLIPGLVKSALGIGLLLAEGIGETIRVSLTRDPVEEVRAGFEILRALDRRRRGVEIISCPTCGRCEVDLFDLVAKVDQALSHVVEPIKVAVMGCVVNGPGEAREADVGVAGGRGQGLVFKSGTRLKKVPEDQILRALVAEVEEMIKV